MAVDFNATAAVQHDTGFGKAETFSVGLAAGRDQHDVCFQRFGSAALDRLEHHLRTGARLFNGRHLGAELEIETLLGEQTLRLLGDFAVHAAENIVEVFNNGDLRAEARPDRTELEADHAAADNDQLFRNLGKGDRAGGGNDDVFIDIDLNARNAGNIRTRGDDDVLGFDFLCLTLVIGDGDLAGGNHLAGALEGIDLVLLEQEGNAIDIGLHHAVLVAHHLFKVQLRSGNFDTERIDAMGNMRKGFGRVQQRLRRDAADIEAGAAIGRALFDDGDLEAELCRLDRANITAGARADYNYIICHVRFPD
ncbi:hypothetical protein D3C71_1148300 [compost metagenome]